MGGYKNQAGRDQSSLKYKCNPVEGVSFEVNDFVSKVYAPALGDDSKKIGKKYEGKSPKILSTAELIAAVGQIWDSANSLAISHPNSNLIDSRSECKKVLGNLDKEENGWIPFSIDSKNFCVDISSAVRFSPMVQPNLEFLKGTQKMSVSESSSKMCSHSPFWRFLQSGTSLSNDTVGGGLASAGIPYELGNVYQWMTEKIPAGVRYPDGIPEGEKREAGEQCIPVDTTSCAGGFISEDAIRSSCKLATEDTNSSLDLSKSKDQSSCGNAKSMMNTGTTRSLLSHYFLKDVPDMNEDCNVTRQTCSSLYADYCINSLASSNSTYEKGQNLMDGDQFLENKKKQSDKCAVEDEYGMEFHSSKNEKPHYALARQEHAFAGALAGVFVSLCLHPVDTVKTVIQSCRAEQKSICYIGRSIVSERGLTGLYRGIASNIASSAPISAVYAFTYESVKGALLPHFPKEFHSLAHCAAGGCASVATSFICTPSERIKQQMQVGSHYHNCWNALVGILKKGGLPSLYAGWGAVLCRNVPHSIIKFYTYESLKQMMLPSLQPGAQPNTIQTLVCGGVAGSTAALFTTPFDVVKTRLQTQIPGSTSQYSSVYHALREIGKHEGLRGLYRGLIPRLVMYMSQGALFFTSYEFFKRVFSVELPQLDTLRIQHEQTKEGDAVSSVSPFPSTSPAAS